MLVDSVYLRILTPSGNVDSNDDLIAIISNKKDYLSFNNIKQT